jgi:PAS domain S-box-containing protein
MRLAMGEMIDSHLLVPEMSGENSKLRERAHQDEARIAAAMRSPDVGNDPFAAAVRATRMPMIITNPRLPDNPVVYANDSFCRLTGYTRGEILGRNCRFLQGPATDPAAIARIRHAVANCQPVELDIRNHRKDGEVFWNRLLMAPVRDAAGELAYFFASQVDVTLERERVAGLEHRNAALLAELADRVRAVQESEERLRFATRAGRLGIWELDLQTDEITASELCWRSLGRTTSSPFRYADLEASVHPEDRPQMAEALASSIATGADYDIEYRIIRPDESIAWMQMRAQLVRDADGTALRVAGVALDVTRRKLAEANLNRTSALLRAILTTAPALIYAKDTQGRMVLANGPVTDLIGRSWEEIDGRTDAEFLDDPQQAAAVMANDRRIMQVGNVEILEERVGLDAGHPRIWLSTKTPWLGKDGELVGLVGVSLDITARKRAEARLYELNENLEAMVAERTRERDRTWNLSRDLLLVATLDGTIEAVSPSWTALLGWAGGDLRGRSIMDFIHPDDFDSTRAELARLTDGAPPQGNENRYRHHDGSYRWISWTSAQDDGRIYATGRDITAQKQREAALAHAEDQLRQAQKMEAVGQLTGGIAHDFNNLLTGIVGALELVQRRISEGRYHDLQRIAGVATTSANRAASLIQRLLAFARRQPLDPKPLDANRLVAGMEDLLRRTLGPTLELEMVLSGGLWPTLCDANQLESAILNLAINSRDAMPAKGRLTIETGNAFLDDAYGRSQGDDVRPGQYVSISVTDTGTGMDPEVISHVFEPFFTTKPLGKGTGLGLSMLYGFVKQSGGHVRIYSELEQGTTFRLYLPRFHGSGEMAPGDDVTQAANAVARAEAGEIVLVVDDEAAVRMVITETLGELGYVALEAIDGPSGLRLLQSDVRLDLLITDVGLPGLNGRQLADAARSVRPDLPVLFITGFVGNAAIGNGVLEYGMQMLSKPFAMHALAEKVRGMIGARAC